MVEAASLYTAMPHKCLFCPLLPDHPTVDIGTGISIATHTSPRLRKEGLWKGASESEGGTRSHMLLSPPYFFFTSGVPNGTVRPNNGDMSQRHWEITQISATLASSPQTGWDVGRGGKDIRVKFWRKIFMVPLSHPGPGVVTAARRCSPA